MDFKDIHAQEHCKRGLEVAVAGGHNVMLIGNAPEIARFYEAIPTITPKDFETIKVYTMKPCPCGYFTDPQHECNCSPKDIQNHISQFNVYDTYIHLEVPRLKATKRTSESSEQIRKRIEIIYGKEKPSTLDKEANELLKLAILELGISSNSYDKIMSIAGTIALLDSKDVIEARHISEAISYRSLDRNLWG